MDGQKSIKQRIIAMLERLPDDIDFERAIESVHVMQRIEIGLRESDAGEGTEHEEFMRELLGEHEEVPRHLSVTS